MEDIKLEIKYVPIDSVKPNEYNPKQMTASQVADLQASVERFGLIDPLILNSAKGRENILIGGHQRLQICRRLGFKEVPVVYVNIADMTKEQELCIRLSKNIGSWDYNLLANFDGSLLRLAGFSDLQLEAFTNVEVPINEKELDLENVAVTSKCPKCGYEW